MKTIFKIIGVVLYYNFVCPVASHYMYDDSPKSGYVSKINGVAYAKYGSLHKQRYSGNAKFMNGAAEHQINSHFKVLKSQVDSLSPAQSWSRSDRQIQRITEANIIGQKRNTEKNLEERPRHESVVNMPVKKQEMKENKPERRRDPVNVKIPDVKVSSTKNVPYHDNFKKSQMIKEATQYPNNSTLIKLNGNSKDRYEMYKTEVNVNRKSISSDPQKSVKIKSNRASSVSINSVPNHYRRMQAADKGTHKTDKYSERTALLLNTILDDLSSKTAKSKRYDYKKRDAVRDAVGTHETPRNLNSENLVKYVTKEVAKENLKRADAGRIGSSEVHIETNATPYAVFYRMNPVALYDQDEVILNTIDESSDTFKERKINNDDDEDGLMISHHVQNVPKHAGNVRMLKKMKNFSNYRKY